MKKINVSKAEPETLSKGVGRTVIRGDSLEFIQYSYKGGSTFPVHSHPSEQMTVVVKGTLIFRNPECSRGDELAVSRGELVVIPSGEPHGASVPEDCEETITYNFFSPVRDDLPGNDIAG